MTAPELFQIANTAVLPGWILLLAAPRWRWTQRVAGYFLPFALAALYVTLLATHWGEGKGGFSTLSDVASLFQSPWILLGGWIHYLAFDLFIGAWQTRDMPAHQVPLALRFLTLPLTFLFGPAGLLIYLSVRTLLAARAK